MGFTHCRAWAEHYHERKNIRSWGVGGGGFLEHLHQHSVCDPALEILDQVHQLNTVNPLEDCWHAEKNHSFQSPGRV
jgi:hypothetical protein